jgi:hypothetical protein
MDEEITDPNSPDPARIVYLFQSLPCFNGKRTFGPMDQIEINVRGVELFKAFVECF